MSAYIVTLARLTNVTPGFREYAQRTAELVEKYGGTYTIRGPSALVLEGSSLEGRSVIVSRFATMEAVKAFYESPEYAALKPLRAGSGTYDIAVFEGVD